MSEEDKVSLARRRAELVDLLGGPLPNDDRMRIQGELSVINAKIKALNTIEAARLKAVADQRRSAGLAEAKANAQRARAKGGGQECQDNDDADPAQTAAIDSWIAQVLQDSGLKAKRTKRGLDFGDVPAKWLGILQRLSAGIHAAARGQELPEADAPPPSSAKKQ